MSGLEIYKHTAALSVSCDDEILDPYDTDCIRENRKCTIVIGMKLAVPQGERGGSMRECVGGPHGHNQKRKRDTTCNIPVNHYVAWTGAGHDGFWETCVRAADPEHLGWLPKFAHRLNKAGSVSSAHRALAGEGCSGVDDGVLGAKVEGLQHFILPRVQTRKRCHCQRRRHVRIPSPALMQSGCARITGSGMGHSTMRAVGSTKLDKDSLTAAKRTSQPQRWHGPKFEQAQPRHQQVHACLAPLSLTIRHLMRSCLLLCLLSYLNPRTTRP